MPRRRDDGLHLEADPRRRTGGCAAHRTAVARGVAGRLKSALEPELVWLAHMDEPWRDPKRALRTGLDSVDGGLRPGARRGVAHADRGAGRRVAADFHGSGA